MTEQINKTIKVGDLVKAMCPKEKGFYVVEGVITRLTHKPGKRGVVTIRASYDGTLHVTYLDLCELKSS